MKFLDIFQKSNGKNRYLSELIRDYETSSLCSYYEDLDLECYSQKGALKNIKIDEWIENENEFENILLLGDFGTGKTSFCQKLAYDAAKMYNTNQCNRIPILNNLGSFRGNNISIEHIIIESLSKKNIKIENFSEFDNANKNGMTLLIFDGLDELYPKNNKQIIDNTIKEINRLVYPKSKLIITCRTEYFNSTEEIYKLFEKQTYRFSKPKTFFNIVSLKYLDENKIENIIKKRFLELFDKYIDQIKDTENLLELAHRPVFLDKIISTLNFIISQKICNPNISQIYELHINEILENQYRNKLSILPSRLAVKILIEISGHMHEQKENIIESNSVANLIGKKFKHDLEFLGIDVEKATYNIISRSLLCGFKAKGYKFIPTFQYYFRAKYLYNSIEKQYSKPFEVDFIGAETILFIKDMLQIDVIGTLVEWLGHKNIDIQKYAIIFLGFIEDTGAKLKYGQHKQIIRLLKLKIDENLNTKDLSKKHLVKHAKLSISILKEEYYKEDLTKIFKMDREDYTHRWYALLGMEKLISIKPELKKIFFDDIEKFLITEEKQQIKKLANKIFKAE